MVWPPFKMPPNAPNNTISIYFFAICVNKYAEFCVNGLPKAIRPLICPDCGGSNIHRHGSFLSKYFFAGLEWPLDRPIKLFRFLCYDCKKKGINRTFILFPSFKAPYQHISLPAIEEFIQQLESGKTINQAREKALPHANLSRRTLQRLKSSFYQNLKLYESVVVQEIFEYVPQVSTEGLLNTSLFSFLSTLWQRALSLVPTLKLIPVSIFFFRRKAFRIWLEYQ